MAIAISFVPTAMAQTKPAASTQPSTFTFVAHEVMMPKDQADASIPRDFQRLFKVVEDKDATGGKALQVSVDKRAIRRQSLPILRTPGLTREQAPAGLYRVTVRMKMVGMTRAIGTGLWFAARPAPPGAVDPKADAGKNDIVIARETIHGYQFDAEDAYQEFSFLTEVAPPDHTTHRPIRLEPQHGLNRSGSKKDVEEYLNPPKPTPEQVKAAEENRLKQIAAEDKIYAAGKLSIDLSFVYVMLRGFGRSDNSMQSATVDWVKVERVPEPGITVRQVLPQMCWLRPGNGQLFHVWLHNRSGAAQSGELVVRVVHGLNTSVEVARQKVELGSGNYSVIDVPWKAPAGQELWGCMAIAEFAPSAGKVTSSASEPFSVHTNPWAVMNFGGADRARSPYFVPPSYQNFCETFGVSPGDAVKPFPDDPTQPYFTGMSNYMTHVSIQRMLVERNRSVGVASFMYLSPLATSHHAEEEYLAYPERFPERINWTDQATDQWRDQTADMIKRWAEGRPMPNKATEKEYQFFHIEAGINAVFKEVVDRYIDGINKNMEHIGWEGVRWDGGPYAVSSTTRFGVKVGPGTPQGDRKHTADEIRRTKREVRAKFPLYTEGNNGVYGSLSGKLYDRKMEIPKIDEDLAFLAFMEDGSSLMDEGWMNAWMFNDVRNVIKDYYWGARQETDYCRRAGGYFHSFTPARDGTPYFTQSAIYHSLLIALAGGQYPGKWSCPPGSQSGLAHFLTRFSGFLWDNKLMWLKNVSELVRVDAPHELWWDETAVWRDMPDGRRRYVIPIVNPPTVERFFKADDRFSELPESIKEPIAVEVKLPEGFKKAQATMLTCEPTTAAVPLKTEVTGGAASFELPGVMTFQVVVVEFEK